MTIADAEKENMFKYTGPILLKDIEARLLEIEHEKPMRIHIAEEYYSTINDKIKADEIAYLDVEKTKLQLKRQFILDERNGWKAKSIWNIAVPIIVSIITAYIVAYVVSTPVK